MFAFAKFATFAPGAGLIGLAAYQALTLRDVAAASQSVLQALGLFGLGTYAHATSQSVR